MGEENEPQTSCLDIRWDDLERDQKVYRYDKPLSGGYKSLNELLRIAKPISDELRRGRKGKP